MPIASDCKYDSYAGEVSSTIRKFPNYRERKGFTVPETAGLPPEVLAGVGYH